MEAFINKMRRLKGVRKQLSVEEAWKALSSANMAEYRRYMYKTVRKYYGEAIVVTQEVDDIISSPVLCRVSRSSFDGFIFPLSILLRYSLVIPEANASLPCEIP